MRPSNLDYRSTLYDYLSTSYNTLPTLHRRVKKVWGTLFLLFLLLLKYVEI